MLSWLCGVGEVVGGREDARTEAHSRLLGNVVLIWGQFCPPGDVSISGHTFFFKNLLFIYLSIYLFIYWLRWVFVAVRGLSLVAASGGYSLLRCTGFSLQWLVFVVEHGL